MGWETVFGIARAEARLLRRLVRYWVFLVLAGLIGFGLYLYYSGLHGFLSSLSASIGIIQPKYLISAFGFNAIAVYLIGLVFMSFDVRARDERERVVEVFDTRPFSNLELIVGRFLGILFQSYIPMLLFGLFLQGFGLLAASQNWPVGGVIETESLIGFLTIVALPACSFTIAFVFVVSLLIKNRLIAALVSLGLLVAWGWRLFTLKVDMVLAFDFVGAYLLRFPSELATGLVFPGALTQRLGFTLLAAGLLVVASLVHPRLDSSSRGNLTAAAAAFLVLGLGCIAFVYKTVTDGRQQLETWREAHTARLADPVADIQKITARSTITPGKNLATQITLEVTASDSLPSLLFTLNPAFEVTELSVNGSTASFSHENGLLDIASSLAAGGAATIELSYEGVPGLFGYVDGAIQVTERKVIEANIGLLGIEPAVFDSGYAALLPGVRWLPAAGSDARRGERPKDFFNVDLTVEVPNDWLAAGPGKRQEANSENGGTAFRFAPTAPVDAPAIVASRFASRSLELAGVELEMLLIPEHIGVLDHFTDAAEEIHGWIESRFQEAAELGLPYPYEALTIVEAPNTLRAFAGGWRGDTTLSPSAMILMRESAFPTSRFDWRYRKPEEFEDRDGGIASAQIADLERFFETDFMGGNLFQAAARQFLATQTAASGPGAEAINFVNDELALRLLTGKDALFSAHLFGPDFQPLIQQTVTGFFESQRNRPSYSFADAVRDSVVHQPQVWEAALEAPLAELAPWEDPIQAWNILVLRGTPMSRWLLDGAGREKVSLLLANLRRDFAGRTFTADDFFAAASTAGIELDQLAGDWLSSTAMPGFVVSEPKLVRLADDEAGLPQYQLALSLRNDEPVPGLARLVYTFAGEEGDNPDQEPQRSDPIRVGAGEAVEVGLVLGKPPERLWLEPYLSLNRETFAVSLPNVDEEEISEAEPFSGSRPHDWNPTGDAIVVDDLDDGFTVTEATEDSGFRLSLGGAERPLDQGIPRLVMARPMKEWSRETSPQAWGKYRHTRTLITAGSGEQEAIFTAELPSQGRWRLDLFLAAQSRRAERWQRGTFHLTVTDANGDQQKLTFDASAAEEGWNNLGELEMPVGETRVTLSDETDGGVVIADAIRWQPTRRQTDEGSTEDDAGAETDD